MAVFRFSGEVAYDSDELKEFQRDAFKAALSGTCRAIVVDFSNTMFIDSFGIGILCRLNEEAKPRGIPVILAAVSPDPIMYLFNITGLDSTFAFADSVEEAIGSSVSEEPVGLFEESHPSAPYERHDIIAANWDVLGVLNKGGMGVVYLVQDRNSGHQRVLKTLLDEHLQSESARCRFLEEARLWLGMKAHPFILRAFSVFEDQGRPYIELEYLFPDQRDSSVTLRDHIRGAKGPRSMRRVARWGIQFCLGMQHAQMNGIKCHRDIKPENLLIGRHQLQESDVTVFSSRLRVIKITDFGLSKAADLGQDLGAHSPVGADYERSLSLSQTGGFCGTPPYMPPEQFEDAAHADIRGDIYSFGVVLYELSTGRRPFEPDRNVQDPTVAWYRLHASECPTGFEGPLWPIVETCLQKRPERRFQTIDELKFELDCLDHGLSEQWDFPYPY
ncbi:MAG: protein kinase [Candidatus Margulisiibacteriota bacterium]